ncbi:MAG TPA: hypothetical protein VN414_12100 [Methanosarcina sp.]|nr:hypothetical protein [Methanosarcina sp.]
MTFTQYSDIYVAVRDAGINRILFHIMVQRPSLFNYGSILPATGPSPICREIRTVPQVVQANNPLITRMEPLKIFQTPINLDYVIQLTKGTIDFFPGSTLTLPAELSPSLRNQQFTFNFEVCAGLICQSGKSILPLTGSIKKENISDMKKEEENIKCSCLNLFATGDFEIMGVPGKQTLSMKISDIEIPELKSDSLEKMIECYSLFTLNQGILTKITDAISALAFNAISLPKSMGSLTFSASTAVPYNPAVEDNQLKIFAKLEDITLNLPLLGPSSSNNESPGTITRTSRLRNRKGAFDFSAAISANAFERIFIAVVKEFRFLKSGTDNYGSFSVNYDVAAHLEGGSVEMRDDGTIVIKELNVKWDKFKLNIGIDIPEFDVGGGEVCVKPPYPSCNVPIVGCKKCVTLPSYRFFSDKPDITIPVDLSGLITSELIFYARLDTFYGMGSGTPNRWQIAFIPTLPSDLYISNIADSVGDLFKTRMKRAIDDLLISSKAPDSAIKIISEMLGGIDNIVRNIINIPDDIGKWFIDIIQHIGIVRSLLNDLNDYLTFKILAGFEIEDPFQVLKPDSIMVPVKIPIEFIKVSVNSHEITIKGDVGD